VPGRDRRATQEDDVLSHSEFAAGNPGAPEAALMATNASDDVSSDVLLERILASLEDDKAEDVVSIGLRGRSEMADYMVICSGRSSRQVAAIAEKLVDRLKQDLGRSCKVEGKEVGDWVLIDAGDVIVHVFRPEVREFYQLEKMWLPAGAQAPAKV
jgi:ribosome-associated protein